MSVKNKVPRPQGNIPRIPRSEVVVLTSRCLGRGGFGTVHQGTWKGRLVAVKTLLIQAGSDEFKRFREEASLACSFDHENIVKVFGMTSGAAGESALVMEFADGGPLTADLMKRFMEDDVGKEMAMKISLGILAGLEYLHARKVVHRDLKPDNILLFGTEPVPKISDFGISKVIAHTLEQMRTAIGTPIYMAPEVLKSETPRYTKAVDIYSFALILYQIFSGGLHPFPGCHTLPQLIAAKLAGREPNLFTPGFPPNLRPLIRRGYSEDAYRRPTLAEFRKGLSQKPPVPNENASPLKKVASRAPAQRQGAGQCAPGIEKVPEGQPRSPARPPPGPLRPALGPKAPAAGPAKKDQPIREVPAAQPKAAVAAIQELGKVVPGAEIQYRRYERVVSRDDGDGHRWASEKRERFMAELPTTVLSEVLKGAAQPPNGPQRQGHPAAPQKAGKEQKGAGAKPKPKAGAVGGPPPFADQKKGVKAKEPKKNEGASWFRMSFKRGEKKS